MTPNDVYAELKRVLPSNLVFRYGVELDMKLDLSAGITEYAGPVTVYRQKKNVNPMVVDKERDRARFIVWATLKFHTERGEGKGGGDFFAVFGHGESWDRAMQRFKADLKKKLKR